jgi:hypothetical protein
MEMSIWVVYVPRTRDAIEAINCFLDSPAITGMIRISVFPSIQTLMARGSPKPKLGFHTSQLAFLHLRKRSIRNKYPTIISTSMQVLHV